MLDVFWRKSSSSFAVDSREIAGYVITNSLQAAVSPSRSTSESCIYNRKRCFSIFNSNIKATEPKDHELIILALETLGSFDFTGHMLSELINECAMTYLEDDNSEIRKAAALCCCKLLVKDPIYNLSNATALKTVSRIIEKLLVVGIADPDSCIRLIVLSSLVPGFDKHLAHIENIRSLFIALNDEVFAVREIAISIIGRLVLINPAYVMPSLRKSLIQLLTELEYSGIRLFSTNLQSK